VDEDISWPYIGYITFRLAIGVGDTSGGFSGQIQNIILGVGFSFVVPVTTTKVTLAS
jgi:hypothetical protein